MSGGLWFFILCDVSPHHFLFLQGLYWKLFLGTFSHTPLQFWNIDYLFENDDADEDDNDGEQGGEGLADAFDDDSGGEAPMDLAEERVETRDNRGKHVERPKEPELSKRKQKKKEFFAGL